MINTDGFRDLIRDIVREETKDKSRYKIATVTQTDGSLKLQFAGENTPSQKAYTFLSSYRPAIGDRVLISRVADTYVVFDKLETKPSEWEYLSLINGVDAYASVDKPKFIVLNGVVYIQGSVKNITEAYTVIATLPSNVRPSRTISFTQNTSVKSGSARTARWRIFENGEIEMERTSDNVTKDTDWFPIDIQFVRELGA